MTAGPVGTEQALQTVVAMHRLLRGLRRATGGAVPPTQLIILALLNQHGPLQSHGLRRSRHESRFFYWQLGDKK